MKEIVGIYLRRHYNVGTEDEYSEYDCLPTLYEVIKEADRYNRLKTNRPDKCTAQIETVLEFDLP